jgi:hypothetical protein
MQGPDEDFRAWVGTRAAEVESEDELEGILAEIEGVVRNDVETFGEADPRDELAAIESWASVASYACARFYAPASPWRRDVAGWSKGAVGKLRSIANSLKAALESIAQALQAASYSISVSFPWGVSIGIGW